MDGIPVKISEKYKPPRKFILPGCVLNRINSDIKIEPYSFELERSVLAHITNLKQAKKRHHEKMQLKRDDWLSKTKIKDPPVEDDSYTLDRCNNATSEESTMLTPVPISSNSRIEPTRQVGQINLSDFENDTSSPFDNVELKTINEMEELAHVLGGTSIKNSSYHSLKNHTNSNIHLPNGCTSHQWSTTGTTYSYPGLYGVPPGSNSGITSGTAITLPSPHIAPGPYTYLHSPNNTLYSNPVYNSSSSRNLPHSFNSTIRRDGYADNIHNIVQNTYLAHAAQSSLVTPLTSNTQTPHTYTSSTNSNIDKSYNSYLPNYIPTSNTAANIHLTSTTSSLTKDPSTQLVTAQTSNKQDDDGVSSILDNLRQQVLLRKHQLLPKPPPIVNMETTKPSTSKHSDSLQVNPLNQLSLQSQDFAKNLAEMGFPLPRVARATQHFGADEAKVIEYLLQVQSLEEKNYPEGQIEKALLLHNFKEDEAVSYLENLNQIMKLGFKEEDVELALSKSSNNRDKALDILIS
ncbi:hypothetical protein O3M35_007274 [Rhynocoris fuscipes]